MIMAMQEIDFGDEDAVLAAVAVDLGEDPDDLGIEAEEVWGQDAYRVGGGNRSYVVMANYDAMEEAAIAQVTQDIETEPGMFGQFLEHYIDTERLARDLYSDVHSGNYDYFSEMDDDELIGELGDSRIVGDEYLSEPEDEDEEPELTDRDGLIEALADDRTERELKDPVGYLVDLYGNEEGVATAVKIGGIDVERAAKDAVRDDGAIHFLGSYDGNYLELPGSDIVYWRD